MQRPLEAHWKVVKRILRYLSVTCHFGLHLQNASSLALTGYSDSYWGSNPDDHKSTSGYCVFLGPNFISWSSKKQQAISKSSTEAKYMSLASLVIELFWIHTLFTELHIPLSSTSIVYYDNLSIVLLAVNPILCSKSKHFELDLAFVQDHVAKGRV